MTDEFFLVEAAPMSVKRRRQEALRPPASAMPATARTHLAKVPEGPSPRPCGRR